MDDFGTIVYICTVGLHNQTDLSLSDRRAQPYDFGVQTVTDVSVYFVIIAYDEQL